MTAGRKPYAEPRVAWKIYLPQQLAAQVELLLLDPMREKVKYGARNELLEGLLRDWLERQKAVVAGIPDTTDPVV